MNRWSRTTIAFCAYITAGIGCGAGDDSLPMDDEGVEIDPGLDPTRAPVDDCPIDFVNCDPIPTPVTCSYGRANCDGSSYNGCEVVLSTDVNNCGECGNVCPVFAHATRTCANDCGYTCATGFSDCDGNTVNGCETTGACSGPCVVDRERELFITNLSVVNDPLRTTGLGAWTFGKLMTDMAGPLNAQTFVQNWVNTWKTNQIVNTFTVPARPNIQSQVIDPWPKVTGTNTLDLAKSPFRLLAIVNRMDLIGIGNAGEGRFVFGVLGPGGASLLFTVILEYKLPLTNLTAVQWAHKWHALGATPMTDPTFNTKLQEVTDLFASANVLPGAINGSAISQVRTNERAIGIPWELREFRLSSAGALALAPVRNTPALQFNNTSTLANFINSAAQPAEVPQSFLGSAFLAGSTQVPGDNTAFTWSASAPSAAVAAFSKNTCNGCHAGNTGTAFLHVSTRTANQAASRSNFVNLTELPAREASFKVLACQ